MFFVHRVEHRFSSKSQAESIRSLSEKTASTFRNTMTGVGRPHYHTPLGRFFHARHLHSSSNSAFAKIGLRWKNLAESFLETYRPVLLAPPLGCRAIELFGKPLQGCVIYNVAYGNPIRWHASPHPNKRQTIREKKGKPVGGTPDTKPHGLYRLPPQKQLNYFTLALKTI